MTTAKKMRELQLKALKDCEGMELDADDFEWYSNQRCSCCNSAAPLYYLEVSEGPSSKTHNDSEIFYVCMMCLTSPVGQIMTMPDKYHENVVTIAEIVSHAVASIQVAFSTFESRICDLEEQIGEMSAYLMVPAAFSPDDGDDDEVEVETNPDDNVSV